MIGSWVNEIFMNMIQWPRTYDLLINSVGNMWFIRQNTLNMHVTYALVKA